MRWSRPVFSFPYGLCRPHWRGHSSCKSSMVVTRYDIDCFTHSSAKGSVGRVARSRCSHRARDGWYGAAEQPPAELVTKAALANQRSPSHPLSITFPHVSNLKRNHTAFGEFLPRLCQDFVFPHSPPVFGLVGLRQ
jgi:hypothetical protein